MNFVIERCSLGMFIDHACHVRLLECQRFHWYAVWHCDVSIFLYVACVHVCMCVGVRNCVHAQPRPEIGVQCPLTLLFFRNDLSLIWETAIFARLAGQGSPGIWRCPPPPQHWRMCFHMGIWDPNSPWYHRQQAIPWAISQLLGTCRNQEYNGGVARIVRIWEFLKWNFSTWLSTLVSQISSCIANSFLWCLIVSLLSEGRYFGNHQAVAVKKSPSPLSSLLGLFCLRRLSAVICWFMNRWRSCFRRIQWIHLNLSMSRRFWLSETKHRVSHPTVTKYIVNENGLVLWRESQFKFFVGSNWHLTSSWMWPLFVQHYSKGLCKVLCL